MVGVFRVCVWGFSSVLRGETTLSGGEGAEVAGGGVVTKIGFGTIFVVGQRLEKNPMLLWLVMKLRE